MVAQLFHEVVGAGAVMAALIEAARVTEIAAVVVPAWSHLGANQAEQDAAQRLLAEAGLSVVAVRHD